MRTGSFLKLVIVVTLPATLALAPHGAAPASHLVRLTANRFVPAETTVRPGDTVQFLNGPGGPHNVQFMAESLSVSARALIDAAMQDRILALTSPMFIIPEDTWRFVVPELVPGRYPFLCSPHYASMRGGLTVTR